MTAASQAARAERNAAKARRCGKVLRIASDDEGKRFYGHPAGDAQRPLATLFYCEETGKHDVHHSSEELMDGTCLDLNWCDADKSQYNGVVNQLLVKHPPMGKYLRHSVHNKARTTTKVTVEDW